MKQVFQNNNGLYYFLRKIKYLFFALFTFFMLLNISIIFVDVNGLYSQKCGKVIPISILILLLFMLTYHCIDKYCTNASYVDIAVYIGLGIMFVIQLIFAYYLRCDLVTDARMIHTMAKNVATTGHISEMYSNDPFTLNSEGYISRFQNNQFIFLLLSLIYRIAYLILGYVPSILPSAINIIAILSSVYLVYIIAKKVFGHKKAFMAFIICFCFFPYYTYVPYLYTDSLSMPFVLITIYFFIKIFEQDMLTKQLKYICYMSLSLYVGYAIKGSVIILLVASILYFINKFDYKTTLLFSIIPIATIFVFTTIINMTSMSLGVTSKESLQKEKFPTVHWIMMGLRGNGGFSQEDSSYTYYAGDYDQKKEANKKEIKKRLKNYGIEGLTSHLYEKAAYTWADGTYYIRAHIYENKAQPSAFKEFILGSFSPDTKREYTGFGSKEFLNERFVIISNSYHNVILFLLLMSALLAYIKPSNDFTSYFLIILYGVILFFLMWETRSRYIYNFTPLFILLSSNVLPNIHDIFINKFLPTRIVRKQHLKNIQNS